MGRACEVAPDASAHGRLRQGGRGAARSHGARRRRLNRSNGCGLTCGKGSRSRTSPRTALAAPREPLRAALHTRGSGASAGGGALWVPTARSRTCGCYQPELAADVCPPPTKEDNGSSDAERARQFHVPDFTDSSQDAICRVFHIPPAPPPWKCRRGPSPRMIWLPFSPTKLPVFL